MKVILVFLISLTLFCTLSCDYNYGKYGKDKKETNVKQKKEGEASSN